MIELSQENTWSFPCPKLIRSSLDTPPEHKKVLVHQGYLDLFEMNECTS